ncbi:hypothetical protein RHGRI_036688 [Rhododendron griersonianum]|uniref:ABC transporter domain-containing protein n=1 Tax=Rhododendron griersonianum TaxID=479676 RepID=A0AAV6HP13_9ERIC|nr:hypothetical protein RHGRI_036688 [Rhododendron griersonianum]KAG5515726.1 hypothetical protein RHGRI_036688 [Rhododendron griersonianum]
MATPFVADDLARTTSSARSWKSGSIREVWQGPPDVFQRNSTRRQEVDDEEELRWAAIERLPTYDRVRKGMLQQVMSNGRVVRQEMDVTNLGSQDKKQLMESILKVVEDDNERFLQRLRARTDRVGIEIPKIEVRFQNFSIEGDAYVGTRALPTLLNSTLNAIEGIIGMIGLSPSKQRVVKILRDVNGVIRPSRMTLLLGPPGAGKTTLLKALAGKSDDNLRIAGKVTYCGKEFKEFVPQRTSAYISQHDLHYGEMTVRETLDFSGRCLGVGTRYEMLLELSRREKEAGIKPDPEIDAFMKATAMAGQETSLITDYVLKILGLDICADIMVGDDMRRGISGGQKKRVTTGEMLVGPAKAFFMDEISTGLDSSTTFQIVKYMRQMVHIMDVTMVIALLQPAPEAFDLFDDVILLSEGQIAYQGPRENILEFFEYMGFKCPQRKGIADFLQEVTSKKDQEQYWFKKNQPYRFISVPDFSKAFNTFHVGQRISEDLRIPYDKSKSHPAALVTESYGISNRELFRACFSREWLLMKRNSFIYIFKTVQLTIMAIIALTVFLRTEMKYGGIEDASKFWGALFFSMINVMFNGMAELAMTVFRLPVFFKQRDSLFYPAWAFGLPIWLLRIPVSFMESGIWVILTYYTIGFAPSASRFFKQFLAFFGVHQMALSLFRCLAAAGRTPVVANTMGMFTLLLVFVLGGFIVSKDDIEPWMIWGYWISPMMYGQNAVAMNEFLDDRWSAPINGTSQPTVGKTLLDGRGLFVEEYMFWVCIAALFGFSFLFNGLFIAALTYLSPLGDSKVLLEDDQVANNRRQRTSNGEGTDMAVRNAGGDTSSSQVARGMVLPFQPLSLAFNHVNYYVDMPAEMKSQGVDDNRLQLLRDVSGAFRPGILTALVGVSGAGKTTLMDVLAGRKTGGYIEGSISISGFPKNQETFARVSGYCEQNDIHSPYVTVYESLLYSAWLRLASDVNTERRKLLLMKRGGQVIYTGPLGRQSHKLVEYFEGLPRLQTVTIQLHGCLRRNQDLIKELSTPAPGAKDLYFPNQYSQPFLTQCKACFWKQHWSYWRNSQYNAIRFFMTAVFGILFGVIFWKKGNKISEQQDLLNLLGAVYAAILFLGGTNASSVQTVVAVERTVFYRERAAGMYSELPYAFAQVAIETIYVCIQTIIYALLLFSMIGFEWKLSKVLYFYYFIFMCFTYFSMYGMMVVALTPNHQIAAICMSFFLSFWNLFSGFLVPRPLIPVWWRWYYWCSPVAWTIYGIFTSQVGDKDTPLLLEGGTNTTVKKFLKDNMGFDEDFLIPVLFAHLGWVLGFFLVFAYGIKFLNFQRR